LVDALLEVEEGSRLAVAGDFSRPSPFPAAADVEHVDLLVMVAAEVETQGIF
jgi:hypothetical protein